MDLPRLIAIGDVDEDEIAFAQATAAEGAQAREISDASDLPEALELPEALGALERRLLLARLTAP